VPILFGTDVENMGKSTGTYITVTSLPDTATRQYFTPLTGVPAVAITPSEREMVAGTLTSLVSARRKKENDETNAVYTDESH
jgi:hypothetical protein